MDDRVETYRENMQQIGEKASARLGNPTAPRDLGILEHIQERAFLLHERMLKATDTLAEHSNRLYGIQPTIEQDGRNRDLGSEIARSAPTPDVGAIDQFHALLNRHEAAVCYLELQVDRACQLA